MSCAERTLTTSTPCGAGEARRPGDEDHLRPPVARRLGQAVAHLPRGAVRHEAHGVDVLHRGPRGDEHRLALEVAAAGQRRHRRLHDLAHLGEAPLAQPPAREVAAAGLDDAHSPRAQDGEVLPHGGVLEHVHVHRGRHDHRRARRRVEGARGRRRRSRGRTSRGCSRWPARRGGGPPRPRSRCAGCRRLVPSSHWSWKTGCRERASNVIGVTNRVAAAVITTRTSTSRRCSSRSTSQAL